MPRIEEQGKGHCETKVEVDSKNSGKGLAMLEGWTARIRKIKQPAMAARELISLTINIFYYKYGYSTMAVPTHLPTSIGHYVTYSNPS
jgi:hypothetical protein